VSETRLERLHENLSRQGLDGFVEIGLLNPEPDEIGDLLAHLNGGQGADRVLVDAPCSGLGTLRRHPEIRWRVKNTDLARLAALQLEILERAARLVRPGGWIVYSTCSLAAEENERVVEAFLERHGGAYEIVRPDDTRPSGDSATESWPSHLAARLTPAGWFRPLPPHDPMDAASAVRIRRV
jgi:16S rRNA (cytosine967-C5)-methyltransferase